MRSPLRYDLIGSFNEGRAIVRKGENLGFIDIGGNVVIPMIYDRAGGFSEGLANVRKDGRWGFIDARGNMVLQLNYSEALPFSEGLAGVRQGTEWGYIDTAGNIAVPLAYERAGSFGNGLAPVRKDGKWGFIDTGNNVVVLFEYDDAMPFSEGHALVKKGSTWGFIDTGGNVVVRLTYDDALPLSEGLAAVKKEGKWGFIDISGNVVLPLQYDGALSFNEGFAPVKRGDKWGFVDVNGGVSIAFGYDFALSFNEGLALIRDGWAGGFIDKSGEVTVPLLFSYRYVSPFSGRETFVLSTLIVSFVLFVIGLMKIDNYHKPKQTPAFRSITTKQITLTAILSASAYVVAVIIRLTLVPTAAFLRYHPGDIFIIFGGFMFGPLTAFGMAVLVSFLELVTVSVSGPIGMLMNVISSSSFVCVAAFIYKKKRTIWGAAIGLVIGVIFMSCTMLLWNYLVVPLFTPGITRERVMGMLLPIFLPFNLLKGGINAAAAMLLYKPLITALRKIGMVPGAGTGKRGRINIASVGAAAFVLLTCILAVLIWQGRI
ncbi:MAG: WG repeat-containing protein [Defluviitaleaceae bacterium]|nr:WG repeat-containing protein [Defluviitaleaceae bacterium]